MKDLSKINYDSSLYDILFMLTEQNIIKCFEIYPIKYTTIQELRIFFNDENLYHQIPKSIRVVLEEGLQNYFSTICCSNFTGGAGYWFYSKIKSYKIKDDELIVKFQKTYIDRETIILTKSNHKQFIPNFFESTIKEVDNNQFWLHL
jgi:hypothetical protein